MNTKTPLQFARFAAMFLALLCAAIAPAHAQISVGGNGANTTVTNNYSGAQSLTKTGSNTVTLSGTNTYTGTTTVSGGNLTITGPTTGSSTTTVSAAGGAVLEIAGGTFTATSGVNSYDTTIGIGTSAGQSGALRMSSGSLTATKQLAVGNNGGYGYYGQTGGTATIGGFLALGLGAATASVYDLSGGSFTVNNAPITIGATAGNTTSSVNIYGTGNFSHTSTGNNGLNIGESGTGVVNMAGASTLTVASGNTGGIILGLNAGSTGLLNLAGGTVIAPKISKGSGTGNLFFNGGTLQANLSTNAFLTGLTGAYVAGGGGTINNGGFTITVGQNLVATTGQGVSAVTISNGGSGYIGAPNVKITGGSGSGAAGYAQFDAATGTVTGIVITSPGTGYATNDVLTVTLTGGGGAGASIGGVTLAANAPGVMHFSGSGTTYLTGNNTYSGGTLISAGTLGVGNGGTTGTLGTGAVTNNGAIIFDQYTTAYTISNTISGSGSVTKRGGNAITLTASNTFAGDYTQRGGTTILNRTGGPALYANGGTGNLIIGNELGGATYFYSAVEMGAANQLGSNVNVTFSPQNIASGYSYLTLKGNDTTVGNISGSNSFASSWGIIENQETGSFGNSRLTVNQTTNGTFVGEFRNGYGTSVGTLGLTKNGAATLTLTGASGSGDGINYSGTTIVNEGTLRLANATGFRSATTVNAGAVLDVAPTTNQTVSAVISGAGSVVKSAAGTLTLSASNTYTGGTTVNAGMLSLGAANRLADSGAVTVNAGSFNLGGFSDTVGAVTLAGGLITNGTLTGTSYDVRSGTVSATLAGNGTLTKSTAGTVTLSGNNTYTGDTYVTGGTLALTAAEGGGGSSAIASQNFYVSGGGTVSLGTAVPLGWANTKVFSLDGGKVDIANGGYAYVKNLVMDNGAEFALGTGVSTYNPNAANYALTTVTTSSNSTSASTITTRGGVMYGSTTYDIARGNHSGTADLTSSAVTADSGATPNTLTKNGSGVLALTANNTYTGSTTVNGGTLRLSGTSASQSYAIASDSVLEINYATTNTPRTFTGGTYTGNGTLRKTGAGLFAWVGSTAINLGSSATVDVQGGTLQASVSANQIWTSNQATLNVASGATFDVDAADARFGGLTGDGTVKLGLAGTNYTAQKLTIGVGDASSTFGGTIVNGSGVAPLEKIGSGTITLTGANTYTGTTTISGGTLQVGNGGTTGTLGTGNVTNNAILAINRANAYTLSNVVSGTGSLVQSGTGTTTLSGNNTYAGGTRIAGGTLQVGNGGTTGTLGSGAVTNNAALVLNRSDSLTVGNAISGSGSVTKAGAGTVILSATNTYSGGTTISAGTLSIGQAANLGSGAVQFNGASGLTVTGAAVTLSNAIGLGAVNGTITLTTPDTSSTLLNGVISGGVAGTTLMLDNASGGANGGVWTLNGTNTFQGSLLINRGPVVLGNASAAGASTIKLNANNNASGDLQFGAGNFTISNNVELLNSGAANLIGVAAGRTNGIDGVISGNGMTKVDAGTLILAGSNTYTGTTTISGGTLQVGNGGTTGTLGTGNVTNNATLAINRANAYTLSNVVSGTGSLVQSGTGTTTLSGANTYTGGTTVNAGRLATTGNERLADTGAVTVNSSATFAIGGDETIGSLSGSGAVALGGRLTTGASNSTYSGIMSGLGGVTKSGAGTFTLSGASTYTGDTILSGGTLVLNNANALWNGGVLSMDAGTTLTVNQRTFIGALDQNGGTINGSGQLVATLTLTESGALNAVLADGPDFAAGILKRTSGTTTIGAANTFTGGINVQGGTLQLGAGGSFDAASSLALSAGATMDLGNKAQTFSSVSGAGGTVAMGSGALTVNGTNNSQFAGAITGTGSFTKAGSGSVTLSGTSTYTGGTTISGGTLQVGNGGTTGSLGSGAVTNNAALAFNRSDSSTVANTISGSGAVSKAGSGTIVLTANNSYSGSTTIGEGTLQVGNGGTTGSLGSGAVVNDGSLAFNRSDNHTVANAISGNGTTVKNGAGITTLTADNTATGDTIVNAGTLQLGNGGASGAVGGNIVNNGAVAFNRSDNHTVANTISGSGSVTKLGSGNMTLTAESTYTGGTTVSAGALQVGNGGTSGTLGSGAVTNNAAMIFNRSDDTTVANAISGSGSVTKSGAGNMTLSGTSTYSGATTVSSGGLLVSGSIAGSTVTVQSGAFLGGSGTVGGLVVEDGGTVGPGNSPGTMNIDGDIDWLGGGNYTWQIASSLGTAGADWDLLSATGQLDLTLLTVSSKFNINLWTLASINPDVNGALADFNPTQGRTWTMVTAGGGISGFDAGKFNINTAGFANTLASGWGFSVAQDGGNLNLVYSQQTGPEAVPEPGTWAAAALLAGGAYLRWRKRKQAADTKSA